MQLQLSCEEVEMSLEDCTSQVLRRIPLVVQEGSRVQVLQYMQPCNLAKLITLGFSSQYVFS